MLDDRYAGAEQDSVSRAAAVLVVIDVERIDPHEPHAGLHEIFGRVLREEGVLTAGVRIGAPVRVPARVHQHGLPVHVLAPEARGIDRAFGSGAHPHDDAGQIGDGFQSIARDVAAVFVTMERASMYVPVLASSSILPIWKVVPGA